MALNIEIFSPSKVLLKGEATEVIAPSISGEVAVLQGHTDYLTLLGSGDLKVRGAASQDFKITGGFLKVQKDQVTVLVDDLA